MATYSDLYSQWKNDKALQAQFPDVNQYMASQGSAPEAQPGNLNISSLLPESSWGDKSNGALDNGIYNAWTGKQNTNSVQGSQQNGAFASEGNQSQQGLQSSSQTGSQSATQTGTQNSNSTGLQSSVGTQNANTSNISQSGTQNMGSTNEVTGNTGLSTSTGNQNSTSIGNTSSVGAGTSASTGTTSNLGSTTGTTSKGVVDTLGIGSLLGAQAKAAASTDANRNAWLQDVMATGGTGFNDQMTKAVNSALSGPGMQGVGNGAKGRVAGTAASETAMNNMSQRLAASQQLGQGGQLASLSNAGNAYLGSTENSTGTNSTTGTSNNVSNNTSTNTGTNSTVGNTSNNSVTGTNNSGFSSGNNNSVSNNSTANIGSSTSNNSNIASNTNSSTANNSNNTSSNSASNSLNLSSLLSSEAQKGMSGASSLQAATGQVAENKTSGGGSYVCTALVHHGLLARETVYRVAKFITERQDLYGANILGYSLFGPYLARAVKKNLWLAKLFVPVCKNITQHQLYIMGDTAWRPLPYLMYKAFSGLTLACAGLSRLFGRTKPTIPLPDAEELKRHQLYFNLKD